MRKVRIKLLSKCDNKIAFCRVIKNCADCGLKYAKDLSFHLYLNNYFIPLWDLLSLFNVNTERVLSLGEQPGGMRFDISNVKLKESLK